MTKFTKIFIGTVVSGSLLGAYGLGTQIRSGADVVNPGQTSVDARCFGTGCTVRVECKVGVSRDGCVVNQSGGYVTSATCLIANPYDGTTVPYTGSATVLRSQLDVYTNPSVAKWNVGVSKASTQSGAGIMRAVPRSSGSYLAFPSRASSGAALEQFIVPPGGYLGYWASGNLTAQSRFGCSAEFAPIYRN